ncbi:MAG: hypothetical protein DWQ19_10560 [Crenarchaeota archaeon]|nr:MAG: hypothetical protein DWQ19_10560 [Thermoproteota archaeon]
MTIFVVFTVARMIDGEYVFVKSERAFKTKEKADELLHVLKAQYVKDGKAVPINMQTEHGEVSCLCEIGAAEVELEDKE